MQITALQGLGSFPVAIVIFAGIAIFLILRLRSVLGRRVGFEKPPLSPGQMPGFNPGPIIEGQALPAQTGRPVPDPRSALGERLMQIVNADPNFDPPKFLNGAEVAFRIIVTAFAAGDRASLKSNLTDNVYQTFDAAITAREAANERHRTEIKAITAADIEDAQLIGDQAAIIVRFASQQINVTLDAAGNPASGDTGIADIIDLWTFERRVKSNGPHMASRGGAQRLNRLRVLIPAALAALAGCVQTPPGMFATRGATASAPAPVMPPGAIAVTSLPGWTTDHTTDALLAFIRGCHAIAIMPADQSLGGAALYQNVAGQAGLWQTACTAAQSLSPVNDSTASTFFATYFAAYQVSASATITGYFEPEYPGSKNPAPGFHVPLYAKPADPDLANLPRAAIDHGALNRKTPVTAYVASPADAYILQTYGAGRILLKNGTTLRVGFDGQSNQPYTPIGRILVADGYLDPNNVNVQTISDWLKANPAQAKSIMEQNARYVYLHPLGPLPDDEGAPGTLGVPLTAGRSLAVDTSVIPLGAPVFIMTTDPVTNAPIDRLTIAQDTGGDIHGANADLFFGAGPDAETTAGNMRQPGTVIILLPRPAATS